MSNLEDELNACDVVCTGIYEGFPVTNPPYAELSKGDQTIVNACIAAHDKALADPKVTALLNLLSPEQQLAYKVVRNADAVRARRDYYLERILPDWFKLAQTVHAGTDLDTKMKDLETKVPLWDATVDTVPSTVQMVVVEKT